MVLSKRKRDKKKRIDEERERKLAKQNRKKSTEVDTRLYKGKDIKV